MSRPARGFLLVLVPLAGAILAVLLHPAPADRFRSEAVVGVSAAASDTDAQRARWNAFADALEVPELLRDAGAVAGVDASVADLRRRVDAIGRPETGLLRVVARAPTAREATAIAGAVADEGVEYMRRVVAADLPPGSAAARFGFEPDGQGWGEGVPRFTLPPESIGASGVARSGDAALQATCAGSAGCGPWVELDGPFREATTYDATAYVRAPRPTRLRLVLGAEATDVGVGRARTARSTWTALRVSWTPRRPAASADLAVQTMGAGRVTFAVDSARVRDPGGGEGERRTADSRTEERYTIVSSAQPADEVISRTRVWALAGALGGLVAAAAGLGLAALARHRAEEAER